VALAKRANADRGWGPLNYKLLDHPIIQRTSPNKFVQNGVAVKNGTSNQSEPQTEVDNNNILQKMNFSGPTTNRLATICVENRLKDNALNEQYLNEKKDQEENKAVSQDLRQWLRCSKNWRSGRFANIKKYTLTDNDFVLAAEEKRKRQS
jgi:hypothetical protein